MCVFKIIIHLVKAIMCWYLYTWFTCSWSYSYPNFTYIWYIIIPWS